MIALQANHNVRIRDQHSMWLFDPLQEFHSSFDESQSSLLCDPPVPLVNNHNYDGLAASAKQRLKKKKRRVHFHPDTRVYEIPPHTEYSPVEHKQIWTSTAEIARNVQRNRREFSTEGWNWLQVKEEDEMFFDKATKQYIHPIHLGGLKGF